MAHVSGTLYRSERARSSSVPSRLRAVFHGSLEGWSKSTVIQHAARAPPRYRDTEIGPSASGLSGAKPIRIIPRAEAARRSGNSRRDAIRVAKTAVFAALFSRSMLAELFDSLLKEVVRIIEP